MRIQLGIFNNIRNSNIDYRIQYSNLFDINNCGVGLHIVSDNNGKRIQEI